MKPAPFEYFDPTAVAETLELLDRYGDDAKILAGGQSLVPMLNFRLARPAQLVDINNVAELDYIQTDGDTLRIGAMVRQQALEHSDSLAGGWELLKEAVQHVGHPHIRTRGTFGGSIAHADPAAELPAAVSALGGSLTVQRLGGAREVATQDFFEGFFSTALRPGELLTAVQIPRWPADSGCCVLEVSRRRGDFAQVAVAAVVALDAEGRARRIGVGIAGAASVPLAATSLTDRLQGEVPDAVTVVGLAAEYAASLSPPADIHGPAEYRQHLVRHLVPRALARAVERADRTSTAAV